MFLINYFVQSPIQKFFNTKFDIDCSLVPQQLFNYIQSQESHKSQFHKHLFNREKSQCQMLRKLTLCSLLLIYKKKYYKLVKSYLNSIIKKQNSIMKQIKDSRLQNVLKIQIQFFLEVIQNEQLFQKVKLSQVSKSQTFFVLDYCIKLCELLFGIVNKVCYLGRFYKEKFKCSLRNFVEVVSIQLKTIYICMKNVVISVLYKPNEYLNEYEARVQFASILITEIPRINDRMSYFFMNKYFHLYARIGMKLLKQQDLFGQLKQNYDDITKNHQLLSSLSQRQRAETIKTKTLKQIVQAQLRTTHPDCTNQQIQQYSLADLPEEIVTMMEIQEQLNNVLEQRQFDDLEIRSPGKQNQVDCPQQQKDLKSTQSSAVSAVEQWKKV